MSPLGFIELITVLVTMNGVGVTANPSAPSPDEVMLYAPAQADVMIHVDLQAVVPGNYKALSALAESDAIKKQRELRRELDELLDQARQGLLLVKGFTGIDLVNDVYSATAWLTVPRTGRPEGVIAVRGKFPADLVDRIATPAQTKVTPVAGRSTITSPDGTVMMAVVDRVLLFGSPRWVRERLQKSWRAPRITPGSPNARAAALLRDKPFVAIVSAPSQKAARRIASELADAGEGSNAGIDLLTGHAQAAIALAHDGVTWAWQARTPASYQHAVTASEGVLDLFRASHLATRGLAKVLLAALHSYAGRDPEIDALLKNENKLLGLLDTVAGDGNFQADVRKDARQRTVTVVARGKRLGDVLPVAGLLPLVGAGAYFVMRPSSDYIEAPPPPPALEPAREK